MNKLTMSLALVLLGLTSSQAGPDLPGLKAAGPDPSLGSKLALFGQFVGDWKGDIALTNADGSKTVGTFEWHFGWVLEGKAVQDVWKARYSDAKPPVPAIGYGTTLRYYDPQVDAWRVVWVSPHSNKLIVFVARQAGSEIVMEARADQGRQVRWIFSEITPQSFHWRSATSPDGNAWIVGQTMSARRVANTNAEQRTSESDRKVIEALEGEWLKAESDQAALGSILATDFVHPVPPGVFLTKAEHIDWETKHPRPRGRKVRFEKLSVRLYGDVAIANGVVDDSAQAGGDSHRTIFTDVFAYRDGRWQAVNAQENAIVPMR